MAYTPTYHNLAVNGTVNVHYVEAGSTSSPKLLLLHGFPSSSTQFRDLIRCREENAERAEQLFGRLLDLLGLV